MKQSIFSEILLEILSVSGLIAMVVFLIYGMLRGYLMEKEVRLRNRRKYS